MNRKVLLTSIVSIMFGITVAYGDSTITSKGYVDTQIDTTQVKIPATGTGNGGIGNTVMTYTNTPGRIGERGIYTGESSYNASSDADKLITASALKDAFDSIPTTDTTTLVCANPGTCDLWTIVEQTAMGPSAAIDLSALVNVSPTGRCYKSLRDGSVQDSGCTSTPSNYGDWGVVLPYNDSTIQVNGISACSTVNEGLSRGGIPTNQSGVQADYEANMNAAPTTSPVGGKCYCKMTDPTTSAARWVFNYSLNASDCAGGCASRCADRVQRNSDFRGAVFGASAN